MRLDDPLTRLHESAPYLDPASIAAELAGLAGHDWIACPGGALGSAAAPLVAVGGAANLDFALAGPMRPTPALARCPQLAAALAGLGVPVSRCYLVRLAAGALTTPAADATYHGFRRASLCVPLVTDPAVRFECGGEQVHMAVGEVWLFDSSRVHRLCNGSAHDCVHLLVETREPRSSAPGPLALESHRFEVLGHAEVVALTDEILTELDTRRMDPEVHRAIVEGIAWIRHRWHHAFDRFGSHSAGELAYQDIIADARELLLPRLPPGGAGIRAVNILLTMLWMSPPAPRILRRPSAPWRPQSSPPPPTPEYERPVFVVSAPRAGSTLLFDLLARLPDVWTIGGESHELIRAIPELHPAARDYQSDRLTAADAAPPIVVALRDSVAARLLDRDGRAYAGLAPPHRPARLRLVEKTPANSLRIPFLRAVFPGAQFIHLRRDARENISSLVEGWRSRRFIAYQGMPGWPYRDWSFLLPPGWASLAGRSLVEIAAYQWHTTEAIIAADLGELPAAAKLDVRYEDLVRAPGAALRTICEHLGLHLDERADAALAAPLAHTRVTVSAPAPDKWRRHEDELAAALAGLSHR
jgi:LPS sulfotransferase NodH